MGTLLTVQHPSATSEVACVFIAHKLLNLPGSGYLTSCALDGDQDNFHCHKVYKEMVEFVAKQVADMYSPRLRKTEGKGPKDPKRNVRDLLKRVQKVCQESVMPDNCCPEKCFEKFNAKQIFYRRMHIAAKHYAKRKDDLSAVVKTCWQRGRANRDDYEWVAGGLIVCRTFFVYYQNVGSTTLQKVCNDTKSRSGLIGSQNSHGNWRRKRPGKGRQDSAAWMQALFANVAQSRPNDSICRGGETRAREFLPTAIFRTFQAVYQYYRHQFRSEEGKQPVSFATFRQAWLQHHFQVTQFWKCLASVRWCLPFLLGRFGCSALPTNRPVSPAKLSNCLHRKSHDTPIAMLPA